MARRRAPPPSPPRLILDAGAVIALARNDPRARAFVRRAIELDAEVRVPVVVLAETLRGTPRDAEVHRVLNAASASLPIDEAIGRRAGSLLGRTDRSDTVDAIVVAEAIESGGAGILTGDPVDLTALANRERTVTIHTL
ncbi:MAG: PIN domain-containing protein [Actinomycetota bacterium]|nr:PIN domain-containing protein [Actinomycetota bacterium]